MNSLVGYGVSSDSDSGGDGDDGGDGGSYQEVDHGTTAGQKSRNFLLESGSSDSEDNGAEEAVPKPSSASSSSAGGIPPSLPSPILDSVTPHKLPPPPLSASSDSSVFANPFKAQAEQKLSALQKHVPLTAQAKPSQIGGKRICVSYRRDGRCRFGIKCKFAHDSDLQTPLAASDGHRHHHPHSVSDEAVVSEPEESQKSTEEERSEGQQVKKRRVGLSNTLIPPKRALKQYAALRDRERVDMS